MSPDVQSQPSRVHDGTGAVTSAPDAVIDVRGLTKSFNGRKVVDGVSIRVPRGQIHGFLGPNGSGKTTTIRMLCGLLTPDAGEGTCLGFDVIREAAKIKREVGYMTQRFSYYEDLSIEENLDIVARMYAVPERERARPLEVALRTHPGVLGVAQIGNTLRVLAEPALDEAALRALLPAQAQATLELATPNLADVFVAATRAARQRKAAARAAA